MNRYRKYRFRKPVVTLSVVLVISGFTFTSTDLFSEVNANANMITNGDFSNGETGWKMFVFEAVSASGSVQNGEYVVSIPNGGSEVWQVQLMQENLTIENGKIYEICFDAYASSPRTINAVVTLNADPWTWYGGSQNLELTTLKQTFRYTFTMNAPTDPSARLLFEMGGASVDVAFDNISLIEKDLDDTKKRYMAMEIPSGTPAPIIDGNLTDTAWDLANPSEQLLHGGTPENWTEEWTAFSDNLVTWKALWSHVTNMLYVAVEVQDDVAGLNDHDYNRLWQDDTVEFFVDGNQSGGYYYEDYTDAQVWWIRRDNKQHLYWMDGEYTGTAVVSAIQQGTNGNWNLEVAMKIYNQYDTEMKTLSAGNVIGWDVWYDDSDNTNQEGGMYIRDHQVGWGYTGTAYNNADFMHELELGGASEENGILVTNTSDSEAGSLREAINQANNDPGPNTILFHIPQSDDNYDAGHGVWIIQPQTELPDITDDDLTIDGTSQTGYIGSDTNPDGPEIVLNGQAVSSWMSGLKLHGDNNIINHLVIQGFYGYGIHIQGDGNEITGNYIGTNITGRDAQSNYWGVFIQSGSNNMIGGAGSGNLISGNDDYGIYLSGAETHHNYIIGNYIGTDRSGQEDLGNGSSGICLGSRNNVIGGTQEDERNIISGNDNDGIRVEGPYNQIFGNYIGTDITGTKSIGNKMDGIGIWGGGIRSIIGGPNPGEGNVISGNQYRGMLITQADSCQIVGNIIGGDKYGTADLGNNYAGIMLSYGAQDNTIGPGNMITTNMYGISFRADSTIRNTITQNSITGNDDTGFDFYDTGTSELSRPTITSVSVLSVHGTAVPNATVEIFSDPEDEGQIYEGTTTADVSGNFTWIGTVSGPNVTATATDETGNTSGFSSAYPFTSSEIVEENQIPQQFSLGQNYPNPFNPATTITFSIPHDSKVRLSVFDVLGKEISTMINDNLQAGKHRVVFEADDLPNGVYIYQLNADDFVEKRKMLLIK